MSRTISCVFRMTLLRLSSSLFSRRQIVTARAISCGLGRGLPELLEAVLPVLAAVVEVAVVVVEPALVTLALLEAPVLEPPPHPAIKIMTAPSATVGRRVRIR